MLLLFLWGYDMPMRRFYGGYQARELIRGVSGSTKYLRLRGAWWDSSTLPIIYLHGWPQASSADSALLLNLPLPNGDGVPFDALLATGRTIYLPFTGSNFGHETITYPVVDGTGTTAVNDMIAQSLDDGFSDDGIDLIGGSMGATNAINWAVRNPTLFNKMWVYLPGIEFSSLYDIGGSLQTCLVSIFGGADKTAFMTASEDYDPIRLDISRIAYRMRVLASNPDIVIRYAGVVDWTTEWSIPLTTTSSNHFSVNDSQFDELDVLRWLT